MRQSTYCIAQMLALNFVARSGAQGSHHCRVFRKALDLGAEVWTCCVAAAACLAAVGAAVSFVPWHSSLDPVNSRKRLLPSQTWQAERTRSVCCPFFSKRGLCADAFLGKAETRKDTFAQGHTSLSGRKPQSLQIKRGPNCPNCPVSLPRLEDLPSFG